VNRKTTNPTDDLALRRCNQNPDGPLMTRIRLIVADQFWIDGTVMSLRVGGERTRPLESAFIRRLRVISGLFGPLNLRMLQSVETVAIWMKHGGFTIVMIQGIRG
jgi:hypothetical protein